MIMEKIPDGIRNEIWSNFDEQKVVYFATASDNQPYVRPLTMVPLDDKFWILTGTGDAKIVQLKENSKVEVCMAVEKDEHTGYVRFNGRARIVSDPEVKTSIAGRVSYFKEYWKGTDDPNYTLLEMDFEFLEYMRPGEMLGKTYSL
jgi:general stress protein 26